MGHAAPPIHTAHTRSMLTHAVCPPSRPTYSSSTPACLPYVRRQLKVLQEALLDYHPDIEQPSYVMAIPCRPVFVALVHLLPPGVGDTQHVNWNSLKDHP